MIVCHGSSTIPSIGWLIVADIIFTWNVCLHTIAFHSLQKLLYKVPLFETFKWNQRLILAIYLRKVEQVVSCAFDPIVASDVSNDTKPPHSTFVFCLDDVKEAYLDVLMQVKKNIMT